MIYREQYEMMSLDLNNWEDLFSVGQQDSFYDDGRESVLDKPTGVQVQDALLDLDIAVDQFGLDGDFQWTDREIDVFDLLSESFGEATEPTSTIDLLSGVFNDGPEPAVKKVSDEQMSAILAAVTPGDDLEDFDPDLTRLQIPDIIDFSDMMPTDFPPPMSPEEIELMLSSPTVLPASPLLDSFGCTQDSNEATSPVSVVASPYESGSESDESGYSHPVKRKSKCRSSAAKQSRKKEQNKTAALRYRSKKRGEQNKIFEEKAELEKRNRELKNRVESMTTEIKYLKQLMQEVYEAKGLLKKK